MSKVTPYAVVTDEYEEETEDEDVMDDYRAQWRKAADLAVTYPWKKKNKRKLGKNNKIVVSRESIDCCSYVPTVLFWAAVALLFAIPHIDGFSDEAPLYWMIVIGVLYLGYLVEALSCSKTSQYLSNVCSEDAFAAYVQCIQEADPEVQFCIQNYHYETRVIVTTDGNGNVSTTTTQERVNTHYAEMYFPIEKHEDETLSPAQFVAMFHLINGHGSLEEAGEDINFVVKGTGEKVMLLLCHFPLNYHPRCPESQSTHNYRRDSFWASNTTDTHQDKDVIHTVGMPDYTEHMMVVLSNAGSDVTTRPWWMDYGVFAICTIFLMSIPYRWLLFRTCTAVQWEVTKHFSIFDQSHASWRDLPMRSLKKSDKPYMATVQQAGPNIHIEANSKKFEESGDAEGDADEYEDFHVHHPSRSVAEPSIDLPWYWTNQNQTIPFDAKMPVSKEFQRQIQKLLDDTFKDKATRDRKEPMPKRLVLKTAFRIEDSKMWNRYAAKRKEIAEDRARFTPITYFERFGSSGNFKTTEALEDEFRYEDLEEGITQLNEDMNECYLFHGTSPGGALGIHEDGFKLSFVGSNVGTMFGRGVYLAEASSKCDEYAKTDDSGMYTGLYGALLCRAALGEVFRITKSNIPAIDRALASGEYDSVMGDREAVADTYREFVVFDPAQIYPEYVLLFTRQF